VASADSERLDGVLVRKLNGKEERIEDVSLIIGMSYYHFVLS
jgi:hypothetical protein